MQKMLEPESEKNYQLDGYRLLKAKKKKTTLSKGMSNWLTHVYCIVQNVWKKQIKNKYEKIKKKNKNRKTYKNPKS